MEEKYIPLTVDEYKKLKETMAGIGVNLPEHLLPYIWDTYNRLRSKSEPRPCSCQSAAPHWIGAVNYLNNWLKERE
jgi:hypothetical protein